LYALDDSFSPKEQMPPLERALGDPSEIEAAARRVAEQAKR
jgi:hypothetical protein